MTVLILSLLLNIILILIAFWYSDKTLLRINKKLTRKCNEQNKILKHKDNKILALRHEIQDIIEVKTQLKIWLDQKQDEILSLKEALRVKSNLIR